MRQKVLTFAAAAVCLLSSPAASDACTGISLKAADGSVVLARTIEWAGSFLGSGYVVVPRGTDFVSLTPDGPDGMRFSAKYGFAGISVVQEDFVAEGLNEAGLSAGLFYFPGYGKYPDFDPSAKDRTVADLQLVPWMLASFSTVDEVIAAIDDVRVVLLQGSSTVHWRVGDASGRQIVIEYIDGRPVVSENKAGVLTNSPDFSWQMTNLNNYVNLYPGHVAPQDYDGMQLAAFGAGAGMLGLPGDVTPPSRFVRAFFFRSTAPQQPDGRSAVMQSFSILNNFDIPVGLEFAAGQAPDLPSATQWTSSADLTSRKFYFRTMYDSTIRCIDLSAVDFSRVRYQYEPLDPVKEQPVKMIKVKYGK